MVPMHAKSRKEALHEPGNIQDSTFNVQHPMKAEDRRRTPHQPSLPPPLKLRRAGRSYGPTGPDLLPSHQNLYPHPVPLHNVGFLPQSPHPAFGHLLPLPRAKDPQNGRGKRRGESKRAAFIFRRSCGIGRFRGSMREFIGEISPPCGRRGSLVDGDSRSSSLRGGDSPKCAWGLAENAGQYCKALLRRRE